MPKEMTVTDQPTGGDTLAFPWLGGPNEARVFVALGSAGEAAPTGETIVPFAEAARQLVSRECRSCAFWQEGEQCSHLSICELVSPQSITGYGGHLRRLQYALFSAGLGLALRFRLHTHSFVIECLEAAEWISPEQEGVIERHRVRRTTPTAQLRDVSGLDAERLRTVFGVSRAAYSRWASGEATPRPEHQEKLLRILSIAEELNKRLGSPEAVADWLLKPISFLGKRPLDLLAEDDEDMIAGLVLSLPAPRDLSRPVRRRVSSTRWKPGHDLRDEMTRLNPGYSASEE